MENPWERRLFFTLLATIIWATAMQIEAQGLVSANFQKPATCGYFLGEPIADVELAKEAACFRKVVQQGDSNDNLLQNAQALRSNTQMDFAFIGLYWWMLVCFAAVNWGWWSRAVMVLASVAALFDVLENWRILRCLCDLLQTGDVGGMLPRDFSLLKWTALGLALVVLGMGRASCEAKRWRWILPVILILVGAVTLAGLVWAPGMKFAEIGLLLTLAVAVLRFWPWSYEQTLAGIEYAYLMRFQLAAAVILAAGLPAGYRVAPSFFSGLFDGRGFWSLAFIVWAAFQLAWTIMVAVRLVLVYGPERFSRMNMGTPSGSQPVGWLTMVGFGTLALPTVIVLWYGSEFRQFRDAPLVKLLATLLGLGIAFSVLLLTSRLHFAIEEDTRCSAERVFPSFGWFKAQKGQFSGWARWKRIERILAKLPEDLKPGILEGPRLRSGHEMAAMALLSFGAIYLGIGLAFWPTHVSPNHQPAAMFYLLFLLTVLTWLFPGVAFFLDRTRLPVFATLLALSLLTGFFRTDHCYKLQDAGSRDKNKLGPSDVVSDWENGKRGTKNGPVVVVATAGGGIRAAAWTAEVMTQLQSGCERVSSRLLLVSSVSGGSVGSMLVVQPYDEQGNYTTDLSSVRENAARSSLSAVGWGMAYPDLARTAPFAGVLVPQTLDRGWSLENAWTWRRNGKQTPTMRQWRTDVANGTRPAVIFNATVSENGNRFLISSTDTTSAGTKRFFELYPTADIDVATAARLSATFPYVTPLARASNQPLSTGFHIGDGGYYDNSGLLSVVEWLQEAAPKLEHHEVVLILIDTKPGSEAAGQAWSWQRQLLGPMETLLNVRTSSQQLRDSIELEIAKSYLGNLNVKIKPAPFLFASRVATPLSWHLTSSQIEEVHNSWWYGKNPESRDIVYGALDCATNAKQN